MTEDEAKTKWCPHAVASHTDPRAMAHHERPQIGLPTETFRHACIASACMAWRVEYQTRGPVVERRSVKDVPQKPEGVDWGYEGVHPLVSGASASAEWVRWDGFITHGFCGLAGRPE